MSTNSLEKKKMKNIIHKTKKKQKTKRELPQKKKQKKIHRNLVARHRITRRKGEEGSIREKKRSDDEAARGEVKLLRGEEEEILKKQDGMRVSATALHGACTLSAHAGKPGCRRIVGNLRSPENVRAGTQKRSGSPSEATFSKN